jgi:hypothetical protein
MLGKANRKHEKSGKGEGGKKGKLAQKRIFVASFEFVKNKMT